MADFFQTLIATIAVGSLYALVALGYTLVYGILKFINFAHSDIFVLGAWTTFAGSTVFLTKFGYEPEQSPWWLGVCVLLLAIFVCGLTGYLIERFAYRPLRKAPRLNVLITAIGVSLLLQNVGQLPGLALVRGPERVVTKPADQLTDREKSTNPEIAGDTATIREPGEALATLPFGSSPKRAPTILPDAVLNETVVASGTSKGGAKRGVIVLDQAIELVPDRGYRLEIARTIDGQPRRESLNLAVEPGKYEAGVELATQPRRNPADLDGARYTLVRDPLVPIRLLDVLIVASSLVLMAGLQVLVFRTKLGSAMRAVSFNVDTASLMGINVNFVISFTFVLGTALAAAAAFLYAMKYPSLQQPASGVWVLLGLKAFVAAVVGGIGNVRGAVLGGFLIAGIEFFGARYISTELRDVYVFGLLIVVLLVRPNGLLGSAVREKV
ncbi:MAG: branched-chain amino acid ABC transporter permease [Phycisphaerales bacterium]|nr:branched-chain amino acid ABC transporter permease [Phycisphaerales bacterium]